MLWRRGFYLAGVRRAMRNIFLVSAVLLIMGAILAPVTQEPLWLALTALVTCWNFYDLSRIVQRVLPASIPGKDKRGQAVAAIVKKRVLVRSQIRLFITGIFVYIALVVFHAGPFSLAAGFAVPVIVITVTLLV